MQDYSFQFFRHAPSEHNLIKDEWKQRYGDKTFKEAEEFKAVKYSPRLIDSKVIVNEVCQEARESILNFDKIELVICSPMRRCLETCKALIEGREDRVKVVVEPLLSCRMGSVWDIGSSPELLKKEYPSFDFSNFEQWGELWMFKFFEFSRKMNWPEIEKNVDRWPLYLLEYITNEGGENFVEFFKRTRYLKEGFAKNIKNHKFIHPDKTDILVVAHACAFSFMLGKQLANNGKGKIKNKVSFTHGQPKRFSSKEVLPQPEEDLLEQKEEP